jgi:hypothetical protein
LITSYRPLERIAMIVLLFVLAAVVAFDLVAYRYGTDSRSL